MITADLLKSLASCKKDGIFHLELPNPILSLAVNKVDGMAGKILEYAYEQFHEEPIGNLQDALLTAHWWLVLLACIRIAEDERHE